MVDIATWNRLSADEQVEYRQHSMDFIKAVLQSGAADGWQFEQNYYVESDGTFFFLTNGLGLLLESEVIAGLLLKRF